MNKTTQSKTPKPTVTVDITVVQVESEEDAKTDMADYCAFELNDIQDCIGWELSMWSESDLESFQYLLTCAQSALSIIHFKQAMGLLHAGLKEGVWKSREIAINWLIGVNTLENLLQIKKHIELLDACVNWEIMYALAAPEYELDCPSAKRKKLKPTGAIWGSHYQEEIGAMFNLFIKFKDLKIDDKNIILENSVPLMLMGKTNKLNPEYDICFVGTSWSDNDFPREDPLLHFPWAKGLLQQFETTKESNNITELQTLFSTWANGCATYEDTRKPCFKWFRRMFLIRNGILEHLHAHHKLCNWWFNDLILAPTIKFLELKAYPSLRSTLWTAYVPLWANFVKKMTAKKSIILFLFVRTTGPLQLKEYLTYAKNLEDLALVPFEKDWNTLKTIYQGAHASPKYWLHQVRVLIPTREDKTDWLIFTQGWDAFGHPLINNKSKEAVIDAIISHCL